MKKVFLILSIAVCGVLLSCHGNAKAENEIVDEKNIEMTPVEVTEEPIFKVEDGKIMPKHDRPLIVDFSAVWCPPCQKLKPIFEKLADDFKGRIDFATIDVDQYPELAQAYGVSNIPTMIFFNKDGQIQDRIMGFQDRDQLLAAINTYYGF